MASTEGLPTSSVLAACAAEFCPAWGPHSTFAHRRAPAVHLPFSTDGSAPAPKLRQKATVHFDTVAFPFAEEVFDALVSGGTTGRLSASADDSLSRGGGSFQKTLQERGTLGKLHEAALATNPAKDPCKNGNLKLPKGNAGRNIMRRVRKIYYRFICEVVAPMISSESGDCDSVMFQSTPALRMVPPSRKQATHAHIDAMYFHQPGQINFWMPLSRVAGTNTLWVESLEGRGDFASLDLEYGQCARFYGNRCLHFTVPNVSEDTRVTLDFRALAGPIFDNDWWASRVRPADGAALPGRGAAAQCFALGGYYSECRRDAATGRWQVCEAPRPLATSGEEASDGAAGGEVEGAPAGEAPVMKKACSCEACVRVSKWLPGAAASPGESSLKNDSPREWAAASRP